MSLSYSEAAAERLAETGFLEKPLGSFDFPEIQNVEDTRYMAFGSVPDAWTVLYSVIPYSTKLSDDSIKLRLAAQHAALGDEYALVGIEAYNPTEKRLDHEQRHEIKAGIFRPFSERALRVIEATKLRPDQQVGLYGYSLGADVASEVTYDVLTDPSRGIVAFDVLGIYEAARMRNRNRGAVALAFAGSGKDLWQNILDSESPALLEARGVADTSEQSKKAHAAAVNKVVLNYNLADPRGNLAIMKGFGHDITKHQLKVITANRDMPLTTIGRMRDSTLMPADFDADLESSHRLVIKEYPGDHSAADNLKKSVEFILQTARTLA
jgi:hypothetical protein